MTILWTVWTRTENVKTDWPVVTVNVRTRKRVRNTVVNVEIHATENASTVSVWWKTVNENPNPFSVPWTNWRRKIVQPLVQPKPPPRPLKSSRCWRNTPRKEKEMKKRRKVLFTLFSYFLNCEPSFHYKNSPFDIMCIQDLFPRRLGKMKNLRDEIWFFGEIDFFENFWYFFVNRFFVLNGDKHKFKSEIQIVRRSFTNDRITSVI